MLLNIKVVSWSLGLFTSFTFLALRRFMWVDFNPRVLFQPYLARLFCIQGSLKT